MRMFMCIYEKDQKLKSLGFDVFKSILFVLLFLPTPIFIRKNNIYKKKKKISRFILNFRVCR